MKYAPIDAADAYTSLMGGTFSDVSEALPYTAGHHGVASVMKVGTSLHEGLLFMLYSACDGVVLGLRRTREAVDLSLLICRLLE